MILLTLLVVLVCWRLWSPCVHLQTLLCWLCWGCVTVPASSSVSSLPAGCASGCALGNSLLDGLLGYVQHFVTWMHPAHCPWYLSTCVCPLYLDPLLKELPTLGLVVGPVSAFPWGLFLWPLVLPERCHFQKLMVRWEAVRGIFWRKKESYWDWWTFPYLPTWGFLKWTLLQEKCSLSSDFTFVCP